MMMMTVRVRERRHRQRKVKFAWKMWRGRQGEKKEEEKFGVEN